MQPREGPWGRFITLQRPSWLLPVLQLRGFWRLMDVAGWGPGASGWPRLCPQEQQQQQHRAPSPGSPAPHAVQKNESCCKEGGQETEGKGSRESSGRCTHTHRESRQSLVEDGTACLALVIAAGWLLPVEDSPASSADRGHGGRDRTEMRGLPGHQRPRALCLLVPGRKGLQ